MSRGEIIIQNYLMDHNIKYENQKKFKDCKNIFPLPFDFYLPDYNMCIEFDGEQHFKQIHNWRFEQTLKNDIIKTNFCKNNNIDLLRIKYDENIIDRLKKKL
jgi:very-short-patch-repair endonuclease